MRLRRRCAAPRDQSRGTSLQRTGVRPRYKSEIPERSRSREMRGWEKIWHRENAIWSRKIGGEILDLAGRHSRESAIAIMKEFRMAEGNFVTKNARSEVKIFATEM